MTNEQPTKETHKATRIGIEWYSYRGFQIEQKEEPAHFGTKSSHREWDIFESTGDRYEDRCEWCETTWRLRDAKALIDRWYDQGYQPPATS